jgi:hypothetical protein
MRQLVGDPVSIGRQEAGPTAQYNVIREQRRSAFWHGRAQQTLHCLIADGSVKL